VHHLSAADWAAYIAAIHAAIASGEYQKIVAARRCVVELRRTLEDTGFMARVFAAYPDCTHFAIRRERSTFLGATPETLFRKQGLHLETHALAGTTRLNEKHSATESSRDIAALQASTKDRDEHELVVQRICSELSRLTTSIEYEAVPSTRHVRNLVHLQTPISGELRPETTVFDLLAALHPTPAVGGFPAREAAEWISQNEPLERGWYTGTVGWIDANGDGEIAVAIRCGVLTQSRAYVFAGAGVVAASTAAAEYAETAGKMGPILRALGVLF
jgi:isochorismate synthase